MILDDELKDAILRMALALECINRNLSHIKDAVQAAEKNKDAV